ncbi:MAG: ECF transporter S component [Clostridia bacterium]|nr:ECF transporter S component [Clostridia bacterium]
MHSPVLRTTLTAVFIALVFLLGLTPIGMIPLGFINVTILCVPVIIGTILLGFKTGLLLGAAFGTASLLSALGLSMSPPSALVSPIVSGNMFLAVLLCYIPRLLVPVVTHLTYTKISRGVERNVRAVPFAAVAGSITNTVFYLGLMLIIYSLLGIDNSYLLSLIGGIALIAGGAEAIVAAIIAMPVLRAVWIQWGKSNKRED